MADVVAHVLLSAMVLALFLVARPDDEATPWFRVVWYGCAAAGVAFIAISFTA